VRALWSLVDSQLTEKSPTKRRELDADLAGSRHWYIDFKSEVALSQQHHAVGQQQGLFHVVRHEQDGRAVSRTEVRYQLLHLETCQRVECGEGFIEQQQLRFAYQCARERDSLCLSPESVAGHTFACDARPTSSRAPIAAARVASNARGPARRSARRAWS